METVSGRAAPLLVGVDMGYGHLRAAWALAEALGVAVERADLGPLASPFDRCLWRASREAYERLSRLSQHPVLGRAFRGPLERLTAIRPEATDGRAADRAARALARLVARGFGARLCERLTASGRPLLTTFYAPAIAADLRTAAPISCVVTDSDAHRVWAPLDGGRSRIHYLVPTPTVARRLASYGVRQHRLTLTGFPLPPSLEAGAEAALARRLQRLGGSGHAPPRLSFAVGGAGAQAQRARDLLVALEGPLRAGELRLALVAGLRTRLAHRFRAWADEVLGDRRDAVEVVAATDFATLYRRFNALLADSEALWTKPSELCFYAALGLPLVLDDPVGDHERANARWVLAAGAALPRPQPAETAGALRRWLAEGRLADCARAGFERLPRGGARAIAEIVFSGT